MSTTTTDKPQMIEALEQIETLALLGTLGNPLTALTARLLACEIADSETEAEALERAAAFVVQCEMETRAKFA